MISIVKHANESSGSLNPHLWKFCGWNINRNDVVSRLSGGRKYTSSSSGLVAWAGIFFIISFEIFLWLEVNDRHLIIHFSWELISNSLLISIPSCSIHEKTIDIHTIFWFLFELLWSFFLKNLETEFQFINSDFMGSGMSL